MIGVEYSHKFWSCLGFFAWQMLCIAIFLLANVFVAFVFTIGLIVWGHFHVFLLYPSITCGIGFVILLNIDHVLLHRFCEWIKQPHEFLWVNRLFTLTRDDIIDALLII